jgi:DNA-binding response OmpR family regulator
MSRPSDTERLSLAAAKLSASGSAPPTPPQSVLLCDDDVHILRAAEIKFSRAGFDVRSATDGLEAWNEIERRCPDLVITDCQMPNMSGIELVERIRATPAVENLAVIMLTAKGFELSHEALLADCGVAAVVSKPFSPRELLRMAQDVLATGTCRTTCRVAAL